LERMMPHDTAEKSRRMRRTLFESGLALAIR
jgi:hypothetical protein